MAMGAVRGHKDWRTHSSVAPWAHVIHGLHGLQQLGVSKTNNQCIWKGWAGSDRHWLEQMSWCPQVLWEHRMKSLWLLKDCVLRDCKWTESQPNQNTHYTHYQKGWVWGFFGKKTSVQQTFHGFDKCDFLHCLPLRCKTNLTAFIYACHIILCT